MRLLMDMGKVLGKSFHIRIQSKSIFFLDHLIKYHSDDASSIKIALKVMIDYRNSFFQLSEFVDLFSLIDLFRYIRIDDQKSM
jgi:hypothetical protein